MHIGLVCRSDVDYGLDLGNALSSEAGMRVTMYMCRALTGLAMGSPDRPIERIYELGLLPPACRVRLFQFPRLRDPRSLAAVRRVSRAMRDDGVDMVHILMGPGELWLAVLACLLRDIPVTSTMITPQPHVGDDLPGFVVLAAYKLLTLGSEMTIVNARNDVNWVHKTYGVPEGRVAYIPLGPRTTALRWVNRAVPEEPGTILFFGAARPHKGLEYLVRAQPIITRQVPHARVLVASRGTDLARCLQMIEDSSKFEIHNGFIPGDLASQFFQRASLFALPYLSAASSGILMTAYAFAKPVVATRAGNLPEYVQDGVTGLLVPPGDVEQLADATIRLLSDYALLRRMGVNAARWVNEELSWKNLAMQTLSIYEEAVSVHYNREK
jgi:glycosyltransferase involved in cell wall biosynthesis